MRAETVPAALGATATVPAALGATATVPAALGATGLHQTTVYHAHGNRTGSPRRQTAHGRMEGLLWNLQVHQLEGQMHSCISLEGLLITRCACIRIAAVSGTT